MASVINEREQSHGRIVVTSVTAERIVSERGVFDATVTIEG
jgi:hypothetical protein